MANGILEGGQAIAAAINQIVEEQRKQKERTGSVLLQSAQKAPELFKDPNIRKSLKAYLGDDQAVSAVEAASQPHTLGAQAQELLPALGIDPDTFGKTVAAGLQGIGSQPGPTTEAQQAQVAAAAPTVGPAAALQQLPDLARARGMGVSIGPTGISLRAAPPTAEHVGEATSIALFSALSQHYQEAGLAPDQADRLAARQSVDALSKQGIVATPELRKMALADADTSIDADRAELVARRQAQVERETARGVAAEKAAGEVTGRAAGEAAVPFQTMNVTRPDGSSVSIPLTQAGAFAATGEPTAISLGKAPSKQQMEVAAQRGSDLIVGQNGEMIMVPVGVSPGSVSAGAVIQGQEALAALDEVQRTIADIDSPEFLNLFPSEKAVGRVEARSRGYLRSWIRGLTDPAESLAKRGELRQTGFRLARLSGSNSQLSDAERENAQKVIQPIIDGTATREQIVAAKKSLQGMLTLADKRHKAGQPVPFERASDDFYIKNNLPIPPKGAVEAPRPTTPEQPERGTSLGDRQNNPGHVKVTAFTRKLPGFVGEGKSATDGGKFALFDSPDNGRNAMMQVLTRLHGEKRVSTALRQYSGGGYGDNVAQRAGIDPTKKINQLTPSERDSLVDAMIHAEGSSTGLRGARLAQAPTKVQTSDGAEFTVEIR